MTPGGYLASGVGSGLLGVLIIAVARTDDDLESAVAQAQLATGRTVDGGGDGVWYLVALALFLLAAVLILIGVVGAGVRAGRDRGPATS